MDFSQRQLGLDFQRQLASGQHRGSGRAASQLRVAGINLP